MNTIKPHRATPKQQTDNFTRTSEAIMEKTGKYPRVATYHESNAGPDPSIIRPCNIKFVRGTTTTLDSRKFNNTPVISNQTDSDKLYKWVKSNVVEKRGIPVSVFFFHSHEIEKEGAKYYGIIDALIKGLEKRAGKPKFEAISYFDAMKLNFPGKNVSIPACKK